MGLAVGEMASQVITSNKFVYCAMEWIYLFTHSLTYGLDVTPRLH